MLPFSDTRLNPIRDKLSAGKRLTFDDGVRLYESRDLLGVGRLADSVRRKRYGDTAFFVYNQHLNYTNICANNCLFCAFSRKEGEPGGFTLSLEQIREALNTRADEPIRELHVVGGLNPALGLDYYLDLLNLIKSVRPQVTIKAFTAVEIDYLSRTSGLSIEETIFRLVDAGLAMLPGGGAEVLSDRIHDRLFRKKINGRRWLKIIEAVHRAGLPSNATMLYGHIETVEERVTHLLRLRELQDRTGGFSAFIPLAFHSQNTALSHLPATTAFDDLKAIAVARLMLDNIDHIKAYWVMIGEKLAQVALSFGADDLDGTIIEEKITHMAGATSAKGLPREHMIHLIRAARFNPVERDSFYRPVNLQNHGRGPAQ
ncbi:MAG: aminofutalosine synthase MqnE [Desulfobacterales bacterium]|nr:aminofutalosine synthase MqnE [Desulfobacterales bacterium]